MIAVDYHDDLKEVQGDAPLAALLCAPAARSPFDRLEWWCRLQEECDFLPLIAVARDGDQRAALALYREKRQLHAMANWYNFSFRPIVSSACDENTMLLALAADLAGQAPRIRLSKLPSESGVSDRLIAAFRKAGWLVFRSQCDVNHVLHVANRNYAQYIAARPGKVRTTLKRKAGKVNVSIHTRFDPEIWADYETVYRKSWKPEEGSPAFLRRFAEEEGRAGRLRLGIARAENQPVAAQLWSVEADTAWIHKLAHTQDSLPLSPGTTLSAALFEHVIDRDKVALVDFGTGDDSYKRDWMEEIRPRYRLDIYRPAWPENWPAIARHLARKLVSRKQHG